MSERRAEYTIGVDVGDEGLARLEVLANAATKGPWYTVDSVWLPPDTSTFVIAGHFDPHVGTIVCDGPMIDEWPEEDDGPDYSQAWQDLTFIAAARAAVPALIAEARRLRAVVEAAQALRIAIEDKGANWQDYDTRMYKADLALFAALDVLEGGTA